MAVCFAYALLLLLFIPYFAGYESLGWLGISVGIVGGLDNYSDSKMF